MNKTVETISNDLKKELISAIMKLTEDECVSILLLAQAVLIQHP